MVGFSYVVQTAQLNPVVEITKEVKQCFENKPAREKTPCMGAKIQIRNEAIYKPIRSKRAWKLKYDRHEQQTTRGFFSSVSKPYATFGELELDLRELVLKTMGAAATPEEPAETVKLSLWERLRNKTTEHYLEFDDESNKSVKGKEQYYTNKSMNSVIGERLALMKSRLAAVRAGQSYECCLREESRKKMLEILEEQKLETQLMLNTPLGSPYVRKNSVMASRNSVQASKKSVANCDDVAALEDARKLDGSELQEYHKRKCKNFVATLQALYSMICCVYHLKTRDLRTKVPLSRDYLKVINTDVPLDAKGKPIRHQRVTTTAQNTEGSTDSFHIRGSDSDRVTSTVPNESLPNVSRPSAIECSSNLEKPSTGFAAKRLKNIARPGTLEDIPEPGNVPSGQDNASSKSGVSRCSLQGTLLSVCTVKRRGQFLGMITNTGNNSEIPQGQVLPIWQQVATNERSEKRSKPRTISRKSEKARGLNLEQLKEEYLEAQKRCSKRLQDDMKRIEKLEKPIFRIKLEAFKLSPLIEHDMASMRRATNKLQQDYHDQNVRPSGWYDNLCEKAQELEVEEDDEVNTHLQKFVPFSKDDVETLSHIKSKLCLIIQSLPLYELCKMSTQEALQFFLEKILNSPSNTLPDWMAHRKIKPASAKDE